MKNETVKMIVGIQENKNCIYRNKMMVSMNRKHEAEKKTARSWCY